MSVIREEDLAVSAADGCAGIPRCGLEARINEGVRRVYLHPDNKLRASIVADPAGARVGSRGR